MASKNHIVFVHAEVTAIARKVVNVALKIGKPRAVIIMLQQAVYLLAPTTTCITPAHALLLQACIKGQMYDVAVNFIRQNEIFEIDVKATSIKSEDFLEYFYYSGICLIAVKDFAAALDCFFQCLTTPANSLSQIVVCALKKAKLVALIHYGTPLVISTAMSAPVSRFVKLGMPAYDQIVTAFAANNPEGLQAAIALAHDELTWDQNLGLALQAAEALTRHRIVRLSRTFITLSLADVARRVDLPDTSSAERHLLQLARTGDICVSIDPRTSNATFEDVGAPAAATSGGRSGSSGCSAQQLEQYLGDTMRLSEKLRDLQRQAITTPKYIMRSSNTSGGGGGGGGMGMGRGAAAVGGRVVAMGIGIDNFGYHEMDM